jgi:hypothetical protein
MNNNKNSFNSKIKTIMNKSLNLNTMKNNYFKNTLKLGMTAIFIMALGTANAQTDPTTNAGSANTTQANNSGETIKLIDNKGTIKYLQSNNGITTITSTADDNKTTTTWQLGGTLVEATTITTSPTGTFTIDGEEFNLTSTELSTLDAATNAAATVASGTGSGYTLLVRDELTGRVKKMLATELVTSAYDITIVDTAFLALSIIDIAGIGDLPSSPEKISLYRNGAKLRLTEDYTIATNKITVLTTGFDLYAGDVIEVNVLKF